MRSIERLIAATCHYCPTEEIENLLKEVKYLYYEEKARRGEIAYHMEVLPREAQNFKDGVGWELFDAIVNSCDLDDVFRRPAIDLARAAHAAYQAAREKTWYEEDDGIPF